MSCIPRACQHELIADAGKTTTIRMMEGFMEPSSGAALIEGCSIKARSRRRACSCMRCAGCGGV